MNRNILSRVIPSSGRAIFFLILMVSFLSCKNDSSGEGSFSFFSNEIETLGTAETIQQGLATSEELGLHQKDSVTAFYNRRQFEPAWSRADLRKNLLEAIGKAEDEGLYFEDYHGLEIEHRLQNINDLDDEELSRLDILLTDAFLTFGDHLANGKTDPRELHEIWDVEKDSINKIALLEKSLQENEIEAALEELRPSNPIYKELIAASKEYRKLKENFQEFEDIPEGEMIKPDQEDVRLSKIQQRLKFFGYLKEVDTTNQTNSGETLEALKKFQKDTGIEADGIIGNGTIAQLNMGYDERYDQIMVNLERWRWYPENLGEHHILVNIANYELYVVKEGDTVRRHKTMVGTEARQTPVFSEEVEYIVFNPTWTIPPTIQNKDVIPQASKDSRYLVNKNIGVYDKDGTRVNPARINWAGSEAKSYVYMQNPGPDNPLGNVKIIYPNEHLIYLHDTPSKALFERNSRAESSGCVRVESAVDLAKYLLSDQDQFTSEEIDEILKEGKTKQIPMKQKVKVHHFYWTAWRENGKAQFTEDIYGYDDKILQALKRSA